MVKRSQATERKERKEGRGCREGRADAAQTGEREKDRERERGRKKVFAEVVLDESKPPSVFSPRPLLIARFIRATPEKPFLDHVPKPFFSAHPCPSTLPSIINCFVRSLLCETSFESGSPETPSRNISEKKWRNLIWMIFERSWIRESRWVWMGVLLV